MNRIAKYSTAVTKFTVLSERLRKALSNRKASNELIEELQAKTKSAFEEAEDARTFLEYFGSTGTKLKSEISELSDKLELEKARLVTKLYIRDLKKLLWADNKYIINPKEIDCRLKDTFEEGSQKYFCGFKQLQQRLNKATSIDEINRIWSGEYNAKGKKIDANEFSVMRDLVHDVYGTCRGRTYHYETADGPASKSFPGYLTQDTPVFDPSVYDIEATLEFTTVWSEEFCQRIQNGAEAFENSGIW